MTKFLKSTLLGIALAGALNCSAQTSYMFDNPENRAYFGARLGLDISSAANGGGFYSNSPGFSIGGAYNIPLYMNLYFEPGLDIFYNTVGVNRWESFTEKIPNDITGDDDVITIPYQIDGSIRNFGFRVPFMIGYHFDFTEDIKVNVFTGPQLNLSLISRYHQNEVLIPGHAEDSYGESIFGTDGFKHLDLQWKFGVGVAYQRYYIDLSGAWGMTQMKSGTEELPRNLRRNLFSITLGYNF